MRKNENKEVTHTIKPSPNTGKVSAKPTEGASWSKNKDIEMDRIKCREASEPLFEERSDTVKVSETLCL